MSTRGKSSVERHLRHFQQLYAADDDPWRLKDTWCERHKRSTIRRALGERKLNVGLELGCGGGITTRDLAARFHRLIAIEGTPAAAALARREVADLDRVRIVEAVLPADLPVRAFDAAVASEILYYLPADALRTVLLNVHRALKPGGVFVSANHVRRFSDAECTLSRVTHVTREIFGFETRRFSWGAWRVDTYRARDRMLRREGFVPAARTKASGNALPFNQVGGVPNGR